MAGECLVTMRRGSSIAVKQGELRDLGEFRFRLRSFLSFSERCAETLGVTAQQYQLLQVVGVAGEGGASISLVAARMLLRHNSAVELVDRVARLELVVRVADAEDLRRSIVKLTEKGEEVLVALVAEHMKYLREAGPEIVKSLGRITGERN